MPTIGFRMLRQEKTHWCWLAVTSAIANFYTPVSIWTQPKLMENFVRRQNTLEDFSKSSMTRGMRECLIPREKESH